MVSIYTKRHQLGCLLILGCLAFFSAFTSIKTSKPDWVNQQSPNTKLTTRSFFLGLLACKWDKLLGATVLASLLNHTNKSTSTCSTADNDVLDEIAMITAGFYQQVDQAISRISKATQNAHSLAKKITRSPRATKIIKNLDAAIAFFASSKPIMDYDISSYATGSRPWWCTTFQDHATIQELLLEDIHSQQEKNRQLGTKIEQIVQQHKILRQQASSIYDTPSERLKQSPIINIVTKTVATDMFLRHHNNPKGKNKAKRQQKSY